MENQRMRETFFQQGEEKILGGIPSGVCCIGYTDLEAFENDNFQLIYANEEFFQEIGYTREEFQIAGNDIRSIVTVAQREELRRQVREAMEGYIGYEPQGENGFGYDPIFYLDLDGPSNAQISMEEKNRVSHRGKALRAMKKGLV